MSPEIYDVIFSIIIILAVVALAISSAGFGFFLAKDRLHKKDSAGNLVVIKDPVEGTYLFLECHESMEKLEKEYAVIFTVEVRNVKPPRDKQSL